MKSLGRHIFVLQSGQSGLNILNFSFNKRKLCLTSGADNGVVYILNCEIPPSNVPAKFCSIKMLVLSPDNDEPLNTLFGNDSGSWMYCPVVAEQAEKVKF